MNQISDADKEVVIAKCKKLILQGQTAAAVSMYRLEFNCSRDDALKALGLK